MAVGAQPTAQLGIDLTTGTRSAEQKAVFVAGAWQLLRTCSRSQAIWLRVLRKRARAVVNRVAPMAAMASI
mgnify:CR=1 FL=1